MRWDGIGWEGIRREREQKVGWRFFGGPIFVLCGSRITLTARARNRSTGLHFCYGEQIEFEKKNLPWFCCWTCNPNCQFKTTTVNFHSAHESLQIPSTLVSGVLIFQTEMEEWHCILEISFETSIFWNKKPFEKGREEKRKRDIFLFQRQIVFGLESEDEGERESWSRFSEGCSSI